MAKKPKNVYRSRRPAAIVGKTLLIVFLVLLALAIFVFFYFQRYIAFTEDGQLYLDIPFLREETVEESPSASISPSSLITDSVD